MSGIIADGLITLELFPLDNSVVDTTVPIRFPKRVKITSVSFTVSQSLLSTAPDDNYWYLQCSKYRRPRPDPGLAYPNQLYAGFDIWTPANFLTAGGPCVRTDNGMSGSALSNISELPEKGNFWLYSGGDDLLDQDVAQMDTDEWLEFYLDGVPTRPLDSEYQKGRALISITYTGATNLD